MMPTRRSFTKFLPACALGVWLGLGASASAQDSVPQMPPITLIDAMSRLANSGYEFQAAINNHLAKAAQEKNLAKFQQQLSDLRRQMPIHRAEIKATSDEAKKIVARMEAQDQTHWAQSQHDELAQAKAVIVRCGELESNYDRVATHLHEISNHSAILKNDARSFNANTRWFRDKVHALGTEVSTLSTGVAAVGPTGQAATAPAGTGPRMKLDVQGTEVWFLVNGSWLKPGATAVVVPGNQLTIRAVAMTKTRDFVMNKAPTRNTTIHEQGPYAFRFTIDTGGGVVTETSWEAKNETYTWNVLGPAGVPPSHAVTKTKRPDDTVTFTAPSVRKQLGNADKVYTFNVRGDLSWDYQRSGAAGNVKRTDFETFHGSLAVVVQAW